MGCMSAGTETGPGKALEAVGSVQRSAPERAASVQWDPSGSVLACQSAGRSIELFRSAAAAHDVPSSAVQSAANAGEGYSDGILTTYHGQQYCLLVSLLTEAGPKDRAFMECASLECTRAASSAVACDCLSFPTQCRLRTDAEAKKHMRRRRKRKREKAAKAGAEDGEQPQAEQETAVTAADELEPLQVLMLAETLWRRYMSQVQWWDSWGLCRGMHRLRYRCAHGENGVMCMYVFAPHLRRGDT